ncbi:MAG: SphA family protein [Vicinamibacterales bacterium]
MRRLAWLIFALITIQGVLPGSRAWAQNKGDRIPGNVGLHVGTQPPPGIYPGYLLWIYPTDTIKDADGNRIGSGQGGLTSVLHGALVSWVTPYMVAGGHVGGLFVLPFIRNRIQANALDVDTGLSLTDSIFTPINIGWHRPGADSVAAYSLYVPSGKFEAGGSDNSGLGMVGQELSFGTTGFFDERKLWHAAVNVAYEWHTKKNDVDLRVGEILTFEWGAGKTFYKKVDHPLPLVTNVGIVGYGQFKVTEDSGSARLFQDIGKDRVYALGGEINVFIPQAGLTVIRRVIPEFGARLRTQGTTVSISLAYVAKSFIAKAP